ncbi:MAG: ShlB/FhaC/HecB family hemolysin secretion/activation protein [Chlorobiaceae bacterium]
MLIKLTARATMLLALSIMLAATPLQAQPVPDAGSILRDQKPLQEQPQQRQLPPPEEKKTAPAIADDGLSVELRGFTFSGYEGIATEAELKALVASSVGKTLSSRALHILADKMTTSFKQKGFYQARAYLPSQDITSGIIHIAVMQVKSDGSISIKRERTTRISDRVVRGIAQPALRAAQAVNEHELERAMLLINDLPGVTAKASLYPGALSGTSSVEVAVSEGPLLAGTLSADNQGDRYTGIWRSSAMVSISDPLRRGDQVTLLLTEASGLLQGRVGYAFPLFSNGLRANLAYSGMRYDLGGDLAPLQFKGKSNSIDAGLSYPVLRTRLANITTTLTYGFRALVDTGEDTTLRDKKLNNVTVNLNGERYDQFIGGGCTSGNLGFTTGRLHESVADISLTGAEGGYTHFNFGLTRLQRLGERLNLTFTGSAQVATGNLDSSEKMSLGGPGGVRAYPGGEAAGDNGQLLNAELRYTLPLSPAWGGLQLSGFYDAGHSTLNHDRYSNDVSNAAGINDYWLQGAGIALSCSVAERGSLRASWAHVVGSNPAANPEAESDKSRFWLQAMLSF